MGRDTRRFKKEAPGRKTSQSLTPNQYTGPTTTKDEDPETTEDQHHRPNLAADLHRTDTSEAAAEKEAPETADGRHHRPNLVEKRSRPYHREDQRAQKKSI